MGATIKNIGVLTRVLRGLKHQNLLNLFIFCGLLLFNRPSMAENEIETPSQNTAQELSLIHI